MPNHVRQQLRESVATAVNNLTTTGARVFQSRVYPLQETDLPCLLVKTESERIDYQTVHSPTLQEREITVTIDAIARATNNLDDTLDKICKEVEIAINASSLIAKDVQLAGTNMDQSIVGNQQVGMATMIFRMKVYTLSNAPDVSV